MLDWLIIHFSVPWVTTNVLVLFGCILYKRAAIFSHLKVSRIELSAIFILVLFSWIIRQYYILHTHNVYFDEFMHMELAKTIAHTGMYGVKAISGDFSSTIVNAPKWPAAFHSFLSVAYLLLGFKESTAYSLNAILGTAGILTGWLYVRSMNFSPMSSILTMCVIAVWPLHLRMSGGTSLEPGAMTFLLLALSICILCFRENNHINILTGISAIGLAGSFRVECILSIFFVLIILAIKEFKKGNLLCEIKKYHYICMAVLWCPILLHTISSYGSYRSFRSNIAEIPFFPGLSFWFNNGLMPYTYTLIILVGFIYLLRTNRVQWWVFFSNILGMSLLYAAWLHVDISKGDLQRYQLLCTPGIIGFIAATFEWGLKKGSYKYIIICLLILIIVLGLKTGLYYAQKPFRIETEEEYRFILSVRDLLPNDIMYYTAVPSVLSTTMNVRCVPTSRIIDDNAVNLIHGKINAIYFRDIFPLYHNKFKEYDNLLKERYRLTTLTEYNTILGKIGFYKIDQ